MAEGKDAGQDDTGLGLDDEDRLPWLEAADGFVEEGEVSPVRLLVMVLGGLLLIGSVLGGLWWIRMAGGAAQADLLPSRRVISRVERPTTGVGPLRGRANSAFSPRK